MQNAEASQRVDLKGLLPSEMESFIGQLGQAPYRSQQILDWIHAKGVGQIGEMTNLSKALREELDRTAYISRLREVARQESQTGQAVKFLFELPASALNRCLLSTGRDARSVCLRKWAVR
jgi:23S rRNA (adenine2503-C2)-methyltransferase